MLACRLDGALTKIRGYREASEFSWFAGQSCYFGRRSRRRLRSGVGRTGSDVPEPHQAGRGIATLNLGGIVNQFDTPLKLNGNTDNGSNLNLEGNGLKKNLSSFEAGGAWRFLSRHRIDVQYFSAKRSGTQTYNNEITIRDNVYPIGATVSVEAKDNFLLADYRYSLSKPTKSSSQDCSVSMAASSSSTSARRETIFFATRVPSTRRRRRPYRCR